MQDSIDNLIDSFDDFKRNYSKSKRWNSDIERNVRSTQMHVDFLNKSYNKFPYSFYNIFPPVDDGNFQDILDEMNLKTIQQNGLRDDYEFFPVIKTHDMSDDDKFGLLENGFKPCLYTCFYSSDGEIDFRKLSIMYRRDISHLLNRYNLNLVDIYLGMNSGSKTKNLKIDEFPEQHNKTHSVIGFFSTFEKNESVSESTNGDDIDFIKDRFQEMEDDGFKISYTSGNNFASGFYEDRHRYIKYDVVIDITDYFANGLIVRIYPLDSNDILRIESSLRKIVKGMPRRYHGTYQVRYNPECHIRFDISYSY